MSEFIYYLCQTVKQRHGRNRELRLGSELNCEIANWTNEGTVLAEDPGRQKGVGARFKGGGVNRQNCW